MNTTTHGGALAPSRSAPAAARAAMRLLAGLRVGCLDLQWPDGTRSRFGSAAALPRASLQLSDWQVCGDALRHGDIGFAEGYIAGRWTTPDLPALLALMVANREALESAVYGTWWGALAARLRHLLNRNSRRGSRRNIHAHYDIGNDFYELWLDPSMNYSSAWFDGDLARPSDQAQAAKIDRALAQCRIAPGERLLEIGCGWGALAEAAARQRVRVTGVTLSSEQLGYAQQRIGRAGLAADLRLQDYRDIGDAPFDAVVSIEMFEAVGRAYWGPFFATLHRCLKPDGRACIQTITIRDDLFARYLRGTDFIQQYIFPGGLLPSAEAFRAEARKAGFVVEAELAFGADYAETLRRWRHAFLARETAVRELGFDTRFIRIWDFYFAYCQAAFAGGNTNVVQFTLRRP